MDLKQFVERYGIALGVVVALVAVIAVLPGNADDRLVAPDGGGFDLTTGGEGATEAGVVAGSGGGTEAAGGQAGGGTTGAAGGTGGQAAGGGAQGGQAAAPAGVKFGSGPNCDANGRQKGISYLMPPCVDWKPGTDNGGATDQGVTKDKVVILRWMGQLDPATQAILRGASLSDGRPKIEESFQALFKYSNNHYETYGREVVFQNMEASGPSENDEAMKADALKIAKEIKPFMVVAGDPAAPIPNTLARELAQLGVLCYCGAGSSEFFQELPPLLFGSLPTTTEYAEQTAEYVAKKLWGKKAEFAGDEELPTQRMKEQTRKFGLIYLEGARGKVDPEGARTKAAFEKAFARYGMNLAAAVGYIYDPGRNQADVTNLIASMRQAGVTTIIPVWDPLYPILITQEATRQQYFPEWFITGTGLSDTTSAGRLYDQRQWKHAFGISPLWVTWTSVPTSSGYREFKHGNPNGEPGVLINIYRAPIALIFRGIHMAGPNLTRESFVKGLYAFPATGGQPRAPLVFITRELPTEIKDFTEVFYAADAQGPDERGQNGSGMIMKTNGGKRYKLGQWTQDPSRAFDMNGAIAISDDPALGGDNLDHEKDGHRHDRRCLSCS